MPKNNIALSKDGRKRYRYKNSAGQNIELRQRKNETVSAFKKRCEKAENLDVEISEMTFDELFIFWRKNYQAIYCCKSDYTSTLYTYDKHLKNEIGHLKLHEITRPLIYKITTEIAGTGISKSLISKIRGIISRSFNWAINTLGYKLICPTDGLRIKLVRSAQKGNEVRVITEEEMERFFKSAKNTKYYNYFKLLSFSGLRPSEALGLKVSDFSDNYIHINRVITRHEISDYGKTDNFNRKIPITPGLRDVIDNQIASLSNKKSNSWLFPSAEGIPNMEAIQSCFVRTKKQTAVWEKIGRKYKGKLVLEQVNFTLYNFRHTFATKSARVLRPNVLQYIMGHKSIDITLKYYVGITDDDKNEAVVELSKIFEK